MSSNSRFTVAVHALAWMALVQPRRGDGVMTSEQIADSVNTNPVVIRRILGRLRDAGLVVTQRGQGAGWRLARDPASIDLASVRDAVEDAPLFALHAGTPNQACPVGRGIQPVLRSTYARAEAALHAELASTSIADVLEDTIARTEHP
ncbi:Rrf2 family transcriptional regulator [Sphaerisporangium fuscum]|uniref:Rrf2 family transcriptional regulator n=1 Tax=Sphaerisporangium fuscum TaxID=2835868 RepID=UPI001BDBEFD1|nr:Rrf2 family transcriptional regulator [Sphaerisporangium fuscum]